MVILLGAFGPISTDMFLPALPDMVDEFDTTAAVMNMTLYGFMFSMAVSILLLGPVTDKYGRKAPLVICLAEYVVTTLLCAFVHDVGILIVLRVLQAIGAGAAMTLSTAFVKDCYSGAIRLKILNIVAIVGVLGPLLAPIAGAALISLWGWRATFIAPAVIALVCLVLALMLDETLPDGERVDGGLSDMLQGMKQLCCTPSFLVFTVMICLFNLPFMAYLSVSSYIYEGMFGVEPVAYSLILAATLMVGTVVMMLINRLTGNIVKRRIIGLYLVLGGFSGIATLLVGDTAWYVFFVCFSVCVAVNITIRPWGHGDIDGESRRGQRCGLVSHKLHVLPDRVHRDGPLHPSMEGLRLRSGCPYLYILGPLRSSLDGLQDGPDGAQGVGRHLFGGFREVLTYYM